VIGKRLTIKRGPSQSKKLDDILLLDAVPVDLLKCDGFLAKTLIYIPSATIRRQGIESSA
jgi:hypothetical protein